MRKPEWREVSVLACCASSVCSLCWNRTCYKNLATLKGNLWFSPRRKACLTVMMKCSDNCACVTWSSQSCAQVCSRLCVRALACQVEWRLFLCYMWVIYTQTPLSSDMAALLSHTATCGFMIVCTLTFRWLFVCDADQPQCFLLYSKWKMLRAGLENMDYFTLLTDWTFTTFLFFCSFEHIFHITFHMSSLTIEDVYNI